VRLEAPEEWRIQSKMRLRPYTPDEEKKYIHEQDELRSLFRDKVLCDKSCNLLYDVILNRSSFSETETLQILMQMAEVKGVC